MMVLHHIDYPHGWRKGIKNRPSRRIMTEGGSFLGELSQPT